MRGEILNRLLGNFEQRKRAVGAMNLEDDVFFTVVMNDLKVSSYLLSVLFNEKITVVENKTQLLAAMISALFHKQWTITKLHQKGLIL